MSDKFAEENMDFVLKLTLEGSSEDDRQTRRVKLPRIVDSTGKVSYEELVGLVIRLSFPAVNDASLSNKKKFYKVKLTYHDVDSDLIYLGSTEELMDAFEQYSEQRFVRINAKVERRRSPQRQQQQQQQKRLSGAENNLIDDVTGTSPVAATVYLTSPSLLTQTQTHVTGDIDSNQTDQFQNVVGSLIKILGSASVAIHGSNSSTASNLLIPASSKEEQENKAAAKDSEKEVIHVVKQTPPKGKVKNFPSVNSIDNIVNSHNEKDNHINKINFSDKDIKDTVEKYKDKDKDKKEQEKPNFIHMRHTCDLCLVTPIIGNRYHATTLTDYDICKNCHSSYGGNEIQFEVVMLDQDRHLQRRWQELLRWPRTRQQNRGQYGARRGKRDLQSSAASPRHCGNTLPPLRAQTNKSMEFEMKEAIQRSLEDDNINRNVEEKANTTEKQIAAKKLSTYPQPSQILAKKEDDAAPAYTEENELPLPLKVESHHAYSEAASSIADNEEKKLADTKLTRKVEDNGNRSKIETKPQYKEVKTKVTNEQNDDRDVGTKEKKDTDDKTPTKEEKDTSSEKEPVTHQEEKSTESNLQNSSEEDKCREKDNSFSLDADGNGSVAGILGETLDKFANGIDEMMVEIQRISSEDNKNKKSEQHEGSYFKFGEEEESLIDGRQENDKVSNTNNDTFTTKHATCERVEHSATILESVKNPHEDKVDDQADEVSKGDNTVDDWQVVNEERIDVAQIEDTEAIALATQLIGSSLFNSGMDSHDSREEGNVSALSGCSISTASSVPTNLASSIASSDIYLEHASIYQRWEPQLKQLKDLGFDEKRCVEVLEKLEAANIGVETPDEEITVAQVVNELFK